MRNLMLTIIAVCVMMFVGFANAGDVPASMNQSFDYGGLHASSYASNYEGECYSSMNFWADQGVGGRYYQYKNLSTDFYTYYWDPAHFSWNFNVEFKIVDKADYVPNMNLDLQQNLNINLFDIGFNSWSNVRNQQEWYWQEYPDGSYDSWSVLTDNPEVGAGFNLLPAQISSIQLDPRVWSWEDKYDGRVERILNVHFSVDGYFIDTSFATGKEIGSAFVSAVPEPATMILLGLGGLLASRRQGHR